MPAKTPVALPPICPTSFKLCAVFQYGFSCGLLSKTTAGCFMFGYASGFTNCVGGCYLKIISGQTHWGPKRVRPSIFQQTTGARERLRSPRFPSGPPRTLQGAESDAAHTAMRGRFMHSPANRPVSTFQARRLPTNPSQSSLRTNNKPFPHAGSGQNTKLGF